MTASTLRARSGISGGQWKQFLEEGLRPGGFLEPFAVGEPPHQRFKEGALRALLVRKERRWQ